MIVVFDGNIIVQWQMLLLNGDCHSLIVNAVLFRQCHQMEKLLSQGQGTRHFASGMFSARHAQQRCVQTCDSHVICY